METVRLVVQKRHQTGKGVARRLRRAGQLPAVLYGHGSTVAIALEEKDLVRIEQSEAGENTIVDLVIEGEPPESCQAILREVQINPVSRAPLHADFYRVDMSQALTVTVPLTFINEPHNLLQGANAVLTHLWREVEVACLPRDIPDEITVDLANLQPGETLKAGALVLPPGVTLGLDAEEVIVTAHVEAETPEVSEPEEETAV
jgi:large subunit ribosomal protein L25